MERTRKNKKEKEEVEEAANPIVRRIKTIHVLPIWNSIMEIEDLAKKPNSDSNIRTQELKFLKTTTLDEIAKFYENFRFDSIKDPNFFSTWDLLETVDVTSNKETFVVPAGVDFDPDINIDLEMEMSSLLNMSVGFKRTETGFQILKETKNVFEETMNVFVETKNVFDKLRNAPVNEDYKNIIIQLRETFTVEMNTLIKTNKSIKT